MSLPYSPGAGREEAARQGCSSCLEAKRPPPGNVSYVALVLIWLIPLCVVVALWAAASPSVPMWTPWLVPAGLAVVFVIAWQQESDDEPHGGAVIAMVGLAAVPLVGAAILVGYMVRRKRST
jgi:hypothetical protein